MSEAPVSPGRDAAIRVMMMPRDTNANGTIFGGVILSYLDQAGAAHARKLGADQVVSVAMDSVEFKKPVFVGDVLSFYTETLSVGRTSTRIRINVEAQRFQQPCPHVPVTTAEIVYVAIDENREATPISRRPRA